MSTPAPLHAVARGLVALLAMIDLVGCALPEETPTIQVERRRFEHRVTAEGTLKAATTTPINVPSEVRQMVRLAWLAAEGVMVKEGDLIARFDPAQMEERLEKGQSDLRSADLEVDKSKVEGRIQIKDLETKLQSADLELDHAKTFQKTDDELFSLHEIVESQIDEDLALERKSHAADSRRTREALGNTEVDLLAIKQRQAQTAIDQARDGLASLEVRAPHDGVLTLVRDWRGETHQVGAELWRGRGLAEIPDLSTMEAEVFVLEADAGGLEVGKQAKVILEARPAIAYPATIRRVDAVAKTRFRGSPVQYFGVALAFEAGTAVGLKPGQRVRATLLLHDVEDAVVVPRQAVVQEGGESRVFVRSGTEFEPRRVATGASSLGLVVITEGLEEGEEIALSPPGEGVGGDDEERAPGTSPVVGS